MRLALIALAAFFAASAAGLQPSNAQRRAPAPWCIADGSYGPGTLDCTYMNFEQCRASASGVGGSCTQNPLLWHDGKFEDVEPHRRSRSRQRPY
jgi:hypothetical protein